MSEAPAPVVIPRRVLKSIVALCAASLLLAATSILFTVVYVGYENRHQHAQQARQAAATAKAEARAAVPLCMALLHLAQVQGTHGDSGATYGAHLEQVFGQVYNATSCPKLIKEKP